MTAQNENNLTATNTEQKDNQQECQNKGKRKFHIKLVCGKSKNLENRGNQTKAQSNSESVSVPQVKEVENQDVPATPAVTPSANPTPDPNPIPIRQIKSVAVVPDKTKPAFKNQQQEYNQTCYERQQICNGSRGNSETSDKTQEKSFAGGLFSPTPVYNLDIKVPITPAIVLDNQRRDGVNGRQRRDEGQRCQYKRPACVRNIPAERYQRDEEEGYASLRIDLKRPRREKERDEGNNKTLFVGDLPIGFTSEELHRVFAKDNGYYVQEARVQGSQCYGFVTLESKEEAEKVLNDIEHQRCVISAEGQKLRINWATGKMPSWKRGPAQIRPRSLVELESYQDPEIKYKGQQVLDKGIWSPDQYIRATRNNARVMINYEDI